MNIDMKEEFENIKYYLENDFIKEMEYSSEENKDVWAELQISHLRVVNKMIDMANAYQKGFIITRSSQLEAIDTLNYIYGNFLEIFPDEAFVKRDI